MTDNNITELCRLLDERGVEHEERAVFSKIAVVWKGDACQWVAMDDEKGLAVAVYKDYLTPEQAVAATLGAVKPCPWCGRDMDKRSEADKDNEGHTWYRDDSDYIQGLIRSNEFMKKERATLGAGECENQWVKIGKGFCCSECFFTVPFIDKTFAYCPNCGKAVKR